MSKGSTLPSIFDRATVDDVLRLNGLAAANRNGYFRCPSHADGGRFNAHVSKDRRSWYCHRCGAKGGIADLIVALGVARDRAAAARWLEAAR